MEQSHFLLQIPTSVANVVNDDVANLIGRLETVSPPHYMTRRARFVRSLLVIHAAFVQLLGGKKPQKLIFSHQDVCLL